MKMLFVRMTLGAAVLFCMIGLRDAAAAPPNIVLIIADDQGWSDYGFMEHPHIRTQNIDRLARESLTFTRGYVPTALCRPSLAAIISGKYPHQHRLVGNDPRPPADVEKTAAQNWRTDPRYLQVRSKYIEHIDGQPTLPKILHERLGYVSHQSGKWWEGNFSRGGFTHGMTHGDPVRGGRHGDDGLAIGRKGMRPVLEFIDRAVADETPFFVWYAPFLPHAPHTPPERLLDKYRDKTPHLPIAKYWAMCEWFDETVGELLNHLDESRIAENTIVLYVADNGWINREDASAYAPRSKASPYDGGIRTPIMVRWPGRVTPKIENERLASSIDLAPTILAAAGVAVPPELPGINLLDPAAVNKRTAIFGEIFEITAQHMTDPAASLRFRWVISGDWKLIVPHPPRELRTPIELFHITRDPFEEHNVADGHPEVVKGLRQQLDDWWSVQ